MGRCSPHHYQFFIDAEGNWFCEGFPVTDPELVATLAGSLFLAEDGYWVRCEDEVHPVAVADAPLVVARVEVEVIAGVKLNQVVLHLADGRREVLDGSTLEVGEGNVLYCRATAAGLWTRFSRPAYYDLMRFVQMEGNYERFFLDIGPQRHYLHRAAGADSSRGSTSELPG